MKPSRFNPIIKLPRSSKLTRKSILIIVLAVVVSLGIVGSFAGYKYFKAGQLLKECERVYSERNYIRATFVCKKSVNYWFRDHVTDKADKAMVLYNSHKDYLQGLGAFSDQKWKEAIDYLSNVSEDDPDYADAVEKIASAKTELAAKEKSKKVAGATDEKSSSSVVYVPSPTAKKPTSPPKISTSTQNKLSKLEDKIKELSKPITPSPPDNLTLSLSKSQIAAIVEIRCMNKDFTGLLPYKGSGTIYSSKGYIYTNRHVIEQQDGSVAFTFCGIAVTNDISKPPVYKYIAQLDAYSSATDVADLSIWWDIDFNDLPSSKVFPNIQIGSSSSMSPGDPIWVAGYPDYGGFTWTLTEGIISGWVGNVLKTDAQISNGNSGGAALNKNKQLIGIPTWTGTGGGGSLGYIITLDEVTSLEDWVYLY